MAETDVQTFDKEWVYILQLDHRRQSSDDCWPLDLAESFAQADTFACMKITADWEPCFVMVDPLQGGDVCWVPGDLWGFYGPIACSIGSEVKPSPWQNNQKGIVNQRFCKVIQWRFVPLRFLLFSVGGSDSTYQCISLSFLLTQVAVFREN